MYLRIPFRRQQTDYDCGPASLQMVLAYFSTLQSQSSLAKTAQTKKLSGTSHHGMIKAATSANFYCYVNNGSSIEEIRHFLQRRLPVIVNFIEPSGDDGHYAVVRGVTRKKMLLSDPWNGQNFHLAESVFMKRWHDSANEHKRWIMVLDKEDLQLGKQYRPKPARC